MQINPVLFKNAICGESTFSAEVSRYDAKINDFMKENFPFEDISEALSENLKSATFCGCEDKKAK